MFLPIAGNPYNAFELNATTMIDKVKILNTEILSNNWYTLKKITYEYLKSDGTLQTQSREAYDRAKKNQNADGI